jgi:hypothetical protein
VVTLVESFSHRRLLGPFVSDLAISTTDLLVLLIVFDRRVHLVAFIAFAAAVAANWAHDVLPLNYPEALLRLIYHSAMLLLLGSRRSSSCETSSRSALSVPTTCWARCAAI